MAGTVLSIGNFDGVHRGHRALIEVARERAGTGRVVALTFDPNPRAVLQPGRAPRSLATLERRIELLRGAGADEVDLLTPSPDLLALAPEAFVEGLVRRYRPQAIVEGPDFRFGHQRRGTLQTLRDLGGRHGFEVIEVAPVDVVLDDQTVVAPRSTLIRWLLAQGRVRCAARCLGRPYELEGPVVAGDRRGRRIGFPTANLDHGGQQLPGEGVYAGAAQLPSGESVAAAISIGRKPTFGGEELLCEVHLVGHEGPLDAYGWVLRVRFESWLRDQAAFGSVEALVAQLGRDVARAGVR